MFDPSQHIGSRWHALCVSLVAFCFFPTDLFPLILWFNLYSEWPMNSNAHQAVQTKSNLLSVHFLTNGYGFAFVDRNSTKKNYPNHPPGSFTCVPNVQDLSVRSMWPKAERQRLCVADTFTPVATHPAVFSNFSSRSGSCGSSPPTQSSSWLHTHGITSQSIASR